MKFDKNVVYILKGNLEHCIGLLASRQLKRNSYGFEIEKEFYKKACCLLDGEDANTPEKAKKQLSIFDF